VLYWLIPALSYRRLAQHGEGQPPITISGRCYELAHGPSAVFARIGLSVERAHWYRLPLAWEAFVEPGDREYELTVNPATGSVELLRRLGASPQEFRQYSAREIEAGQANENYYGKDGQSDDNRGYATEEQLREIERLAKSCHLDLATDPRSLLIGALFVLSLGLVFTLFAVGSVFILLKGLLAPGAVGPFSFVLAIVLISMALCLFSSITELRAWNYARRFENEAPENIEGDVMCWTSYVSDTVVQMRANDGSTQVFRINRPWKNKVRVPNQHFRITYLPTTHRVVDVRLVDRQ
jgi:hypothetical protein